MIRGQDVQMLGPDLFTSPCGLADVPFEELGDAIIGCWDDFLAVNAHASDRAVETVGRMT